RAVDPQSHYPKTLVASQEHIALAREVAEKSLVLLKNEASTLPFDKNVVKTGALIGQLGTTANVGDHGSSWVDPPFVVTPLAGLKKVLGPSVQVFSHNGKKLDEAKKVAAAGDVVVCVVGCTHKDEGEYLGPGLAGDRDQLGLHAKDIDLIKA